MERRCRCTLIPCSMAAVLLLMSVSNAELWHSQTYETRRDDFEFDGRTVRVVVPDTGGRRVSLMIGLAGFGVPGEVIVFPPPGTNSWFGELSQTNRVIVAAPDGSIHPVFGVHFWNATDACCGVPQVFGPQVDDVDFLQRVTAALLERYPQVDADRVYLFGHSNGGFMVHRMACDAPGQFAAFAAMAGTTWKDPSLCELGENIKLLHIHGTADEVISFEGGENFPEDNFPDTIYPGAVETMDILADKMGCHGRLINFGRFDMEPGIDFEGNAKETQRSIYTGCPFGAQLHLWSIRGAPHLWFLFQPESKTAERIWNWLKLRRRW